MRNFDNQNKQQQPRFLEYKNAVYSIPVTGSRTSSSSSSVVMGRVFGYGWRQSLFTRATGNSLFEDAKFPPAKEKIPENSRSVNYLILHTPVPNSAAVIGAITTIGHSA